jgi:hypothetical protein
MTPRTFVRVKHLFVRYRWAMVEPRALRSAIEFAVTVARARPSAGFPAELKPFLRERRIPTATLGKLRRAIEADPDFRRRVAAGAVPELVDEIGLEWLRQEEGWEQRVTELAAADQEAKARAGEEAALRRAERRREAAEQIAVRTRAELVALQDRLDAAAARVAAERDAAEQATAAAEAARAELAEARLAVRHANDRADAARRRLEGVEAERDEARERAAAAERRRDDLLADRAERGGATVSGGQVSELRELAASARRLADRLGDLVDVAPAVRAPLSLPGSVARDSRKATEYLLRAPGALVLVDGYNVAKLGWPDDDLAGQRSRCIALAEDVARRLGSDITVVFDGAGVVGAHTARRRTVRVTYSQPGEPADDVIRRAALGASAERPLVVVTNDQAVRRDVQAAGANLVTSDAFLDLR